MAASRKLISHAERNVGLEILNGIRQIKRGERGRILKTATRSEVSARCPSARSTAPGPDAANRGRNLGSRCPPQAASDVK
jgi:hypothetical protein